MAAALARTAKTALEYDALARYLVMNQRVQAALKFSMKSLRLEPGRIESQITYALICAVEENYDKALYYLERARTLGGHRATNVSSMIASIKKKQAEALRASAPGVSR